MDTSSSTSTNQRNGATWDIHQRNLSQTLLPHSSVLGNMRYVNYSFSSPYSDSVAVSTSPRHYARLASSSTNLHDQLAGHGNDHIPCYYYENDRSAASEMMMMPGVQGVSDVSEDFIQPSKLLNEHKLSLSLGTQVSVPCIQYQSMLDHMHANSSSYGSPNFLTSIPNSKYLKAAQELLNDVVNVQSAVKQKSDSIRLRDTSGVMEGTKDVDEGSKNDATSSNPQESVANSSSDLSASERQDLQNKVSKLLAILDQVDRRYKQYYHQMQIVVMSFDAVAGPGAAKTYTALALQTISRHFRCLRDSVMSQIRAARKGLGEQESPSSKGVGLSRLRYIDQQIRQQRTLQQFGLMQPHVWRPQRGLPENSVSLLRAWLFEHFLHPYPSESEKLMLARQTGLTRGQVANWFINARVRLWKPMIEEMYKEEFGNTEIDSNSSSDKPTTNSEEMKSDHEGEDPLQQARTSQMCFHDIDTSNLVPDTDISGHHAYNTKLREQTATRENERLMAFQMARLGGNKNGGVSLTLGLQHSDGGFHMQDIHQSFITTAQGVYSPNASMGREDFEYAGVDDKRQHQFLPPHLLHDFVA